MTLFHFYDICMTSTSSGIQMPQYHGSHSRVDFFQAQVGRQVGGKVKTSERKGIGYLWVSASFEWLANWFKDRKKKVGTIESWMLK